MKLRELDTWDIQRRRGGTVSEGIWRVVVCPLKMLRIEMNRDGESAGTGLQYLENVLQRYVYVSVSFNEN